LNAGVNAHEVVRRSEGVIVVNSTVALESLIHGKPVYVLGHWTFGGLGITRQMQDYRHLAEDLLKLRTDCVDPDEVARVLYDLFGEMARFSYNREPVDYHAMAGALVQATQRHA
ncbi:MAG: Capsule polysaccharide biosynthesis protein, partial [Pseudomonadota bacterium]